VVKPHFNLCWEQQAFPSHLPNILIGIILELVEGFFMGGSVEVMAVLGSKKCPQH